MNVIPYSAASREFNTYFLVMKDRMELAIVDPFEVDLSLFRFVEDNSLSLLCILLTGRASARSKGLRTLRKIYSCPIYSHPSLVAEEGQKGFHAIYHGGKVKIGSEHINVLIPGGAAMATFFYPPYIFSGNFLSAGRIKWSSTPKTHEEQEGFINKIFSKLDPDTIVLPSIGPPTTMEIEQKWNSAISSVHFKPERRREREG